MDLLYTPVLFLVFNRPDTATQVFEKIRQAKPYRLYIASDGPRAGHDDEEKITKVREIATRVDWPCEVKTLFRDRNLGCAHGCSNAISWFFEHEEQGIILEDDCVPHLDFFSFCENLLNRYAEDEKVSVISGNNYQKGKWRGDASYYFSKYPHIWGWATWRRAWRYYQSDISFWSKWKKSDAWLNFTPDKVERRYWEYIFKRVQDGRINSWAYYWVANVWHKGGLTAIPNVNLVRNIGFGEDATHTKTLNEHESIIVSSLPFKKIIHPKIIQINKDADIYDFEWTFGGRNSRFPRSWILLPKRIFYFFKNYQAQKKVQEQEKESKIDSSEKISNIIKCKEAKLDTPVLFIIFNRSDTATQVFEKIRQVRPSRLYVAGDGPREGYNEEEKVAKAREIATRVDWPCEVKTLFRDRNLGTGHGPREAITWFFEHEEQGIILEDDCVPHLDFFSFCENLLNRYAEDEKVSVISGNNFQKGKWRGDASYYFSKFTHTWGWATWRRTWKDFQLDIKFWLEWKNSDAWLNLIPDKVERNYFEKLFEQVKDGKNQSQWDYSLMASVWHKGGLTATPNVNLVRNIGFGEDATHTKTLNEHESIIVSSLPFKKIIHPKIIQINKDADIYDFEWAQGGRDLRFPWYFGFGWIFWLKKIFNFIFKKI